MRWLRAEQVAEMLAVSTDTVYRMAGREGFPKQVRINFRTSRWVESEVLEWMQIAGERRTA